MQRRVSIRAREGDVSATVDQELCAHSVVANAAVVSECVCVCVGGGGEFVFVCGCVCVLSHC